MITLDQFVLIDIRIKGDSIEQMKCFLEELSQKRGTLIQLEEAPFFLDMKLIIPGMLYHSINIVICHRIKHGVIKMVILLSGLLTLQDKETIHNGISAQNSIDELNQNSKGNLYCTVCRVVTMYNTRCLFGRVLATKQ